ncbi:hypothetical protein Ancab_035670 [Ancistrocladus abbreviatus]
MFVPLNLRPLFCEALACLDSIQLAIIAKAEQGVHFSDSLPPTVSEALDREKGREFQRRKRERDLEIEEAIEAYFMRKRKAASTTHKVRLPVGIPFKFDPHQCVQTLNFTAVTGTEYYQ